MLYDRCDLPHLRTGLRCSHNLSLNWQSSQHPTVAHRAGPVKIDRDGITEVQLSWDAVADDVAVTGYRVYQGQALIHEGRTPMARGRINLTNRVYLQD